MKKTNKYKSSQISQEMEKLNPYSIIHELLQGLNEHLSDSISSLDKGNLVDSALTDQYKRMIISIEGHKDQEIINRYVNAMPTMDSRHLRACYKMATPDVKITEQFVCSSCNLEQELEVPFGADFFWPDR